MKVLFAIGKEQTSKRVAEKYYEKFGEEIDYKNVFYFKALLEEVKANKTYDRIVISEELEEFVVKNVESLDRFIFNNIDNITDEIEDSEIIVICSDRRTKQQDKFVERLFSIGVYNILIGDERNFDSLCNYIKNPMNKKEAKKHLNINPVVTNSDLSTRDDEVEEIQILNILKYYEGIKGKTDKYIEAFDRIAEQYSQNQLKVIASQLPQDVKRELLNSEKYMFLTPVLAPAGSSVQSKGNKDKKTIDANQKRGLFGIFTDNKKKKDVLAKEKERKEQEAKAREQAELQARAEQEAKAREQAELQARAEQEAKAREQAELQARAEQEAKAREQAELQARAEQEAKAREQAELQARAEQEAKAREQAELQARAEQEAKAREQAELQARAEQEAKAREQAELQARAEREAKAMEQARAEQEAKARQQAEQNSYFEEERRKLEQERIALEQERRKLQEQSAKLSKQSVTDVSTPKDNISMNSEVYEPKEFDYKKMVTFVGANRSGTTFIVNAIAHNLADKNISVGVLDITKDKSMYYIYNQDDKDLRNIAAECMQKLSEGIDSYIPVEKNLRVYTSIPSGNVDVRRGYKNRVIIDTIKNNNAASLVDADFSTSMEYFEKSDEIYIVQDLDIMKMQETTLFLRELKGKGMDMSKIRVIINKYVKCMLTPKKLLEGLSYYNDPQMSFIDELLNPSRVQYYIVPLNIDNYARYIDSMYKNNMDYKKYTPDFLNAINEIALNVYKKGGTVPKKKGIFG